MIRTLSVAEARAAFSALVRAAETGEQIVITRRGRAVAALVHPAEIAHLTRDHTPESHPGLASLMGGWPGSDELVREIDATPRLRRAE